MKTININRRKGDVVIWGTVTIEPIEGCRRTNNIYDVHCDIEEGGKLTATAEQEHEIFVDFVNGFKKEWYESV